jgi:Zinc finger, C3HC4 type (RING finger)
MEYDEEDEEEYTYDDDEDIDEEQEHQAGNENEDAEDAIAVSDTAWDQSKAATVSGPSIAVGRKSVGGVPPSPSGQAKTMSVPDDGYVMREYGEILPILDGLVEEVASLLCIDTDQAEIVLQGFRWNKEKLTEKFFAEPERVLRDCGLSDYDGEAIRHNLQYVLASLNGSESKTDGGVGDEALLCRICCDDVPSSKAFSLGCNHRFCRDCYGEYLRTQVSDGPACIKAHCPEHKCLQAVPKSVFHALLSAEPAAKYDMYVVRNFIEISKTMKYCPSPGCTKVAVGSGITVSFIFRLTRCRFVVGKNMVIS